MFAKVSFRSTFLLALLCWGALSVWPVEARAQPARRLGQSSLPELPRAGLSLDSESAESIVLEVGQQATLPAAGVMSFSEGTPGIAEVRLTREGDRFVLVGRAPGTTTLLLLMKDGRERQVRIVVQGDPVQARPTDGSAVPARQNIRLDFYFVQIDRSSSTQFGVRTPESVTMGSLSAGFDFLTMSFQSATAVVQDQALLALDVAQVTGAARLLRKAALITENGRTASLAGGGEVNIPVQGSLTTGIHRISYGSTVEIAPTYDPQSGRLELSLSADVSDLSDDRGTGAPGRVVSSLQTVVNLELGQAVLLGGLSAESELQTKAGLPGFSQIPVLGVLFGTRSKRRQSSDIVVLIVPSVIDATTREGRQAVDAAFEAYRKAALKTTGDSGLRQIWDGSAAQPAREKGKAP